MRSHQANDNAKRRCQRGQLEVTEERWGFSFFFSCVWLLAAEQIDPSLSFYICKMREVSTVLCAAAGLSASNTAPGTGASPLESTVVS